MAISCKTGLDVGMMNALFKKRGSCNCRFIIFYTGNSIAMTKQFRSPYPIRDAEYPSVGTPGLKSVSPK